MGRTAMLMLSVALAISWAAGCAPYAAFQPETFQLAQGKLRVKGWLQGDRFGLLVRLAPEHRNVSLHSIALVSADGTSRSPTTWTDKTPRKPPMRVGVGVGIPLGGGHGHHPAAHGGHVEGGRGFSLVPGVGIPLNPDREDRAVTAVEASWQIAADSSTAPVTGCTVEIKLVSVQKDRIDVTTVPLAMTFHEDERQPGSSVPTPATAPAADDRQKDQTDQSKESARKLVREIDFTLKAPPKTKSMSI